MNTSSHPPSSPARLPAIQGWWWGQHQRFGPFPVQPAARGWSGQVGQLIASARARLQSSPRVRVDVAQANHPHPAQAAVIVNPSKFDPATAKKIRASITSACQRLGWQDPLFFQTTQADPGRGQTQEALGKKPDVIIACGGDGTVRVVAQELAGTGMPLGLLPTGTGNLLARNLGIALDDLQAAIEVALTGATRPIDVGWVSLDGQAEQAFLVMAGLGYDAEIMAHAADALKATVGPAAYVVSGARRLKGHRVRMELRLAHRLVHTGRVRSVLVGNCGKIQAGITLMPDARIDDGLLDVLVLSPRSLVGWLGVAQQLLTRGKRGHRHVDHYQGQEIEAVLAHQQLAQIDGDPVGSAAHLRARVAAGALLVRTSR